jgi:hypothetical protein
MDFKLCNKNIHFKRTFLPKVKSLFDTFVLKLVITHNLVTA